MTLITRVQLMIAPTVTFPNALIAAGMPASFQVTPGVNWLDGVGLGQADLLHVSRRTLPASTDETLNLEDGSLDDVRPGIAFAAVSIKLLYVFPAIANTNEVVIGGASNPWLGPFKNGSDKLGVLPGAPQAFFHPTAGWAVTPGTAMNLLLANGGAGSPVTYDLIMVGASA